jgi:L-alanine-DL-glutamate epimerase-like enolase superfamily enzyme
MKITGITVTNHRLPLDPPFHASWDPQPRTRFQATIVRVATDEGLVGIGSGDTMLGFAGHERFFIGQDPLDLERHHRIIDNLSFHYGRCWPLDIALWDLAGKVQGQPCWKLLGGLSHRVRAYASSGTLREPSAMAANAQRYLELGFPAMKVRFHRTDWRDDIKTVAAIRKAVGDRLVLMVDCNQGWRMPWDTAPAWTLKDALAVARALEEFDVYWMEEPLHRADYDGMAALRRMTGVRIAGGELNRELFEFRTLIERGCLDVLQPDATCSGGLTGLSRVARMAREHGLAFTPHTWGDGLAVVANVHLAAGLAGSAYVEFPYDPPEWSLERRDFILAQPFHAGADGWLDLSDRPGLGVELDEGRLAHTKI